MNNQENYLTTQPIPTLIRHIAVPASIGFFFNTMFNVVDTFYGGLLSTQALAALSLSFPIFFIIIAMGMGLSTGVTALIANSLGAGKRSRALRFATQGISFSILFSLILTAAGGALSPWLFGILGAKGEYLDLSLSYMNIIFYGAVFFMLVFSLNAILNAQGDTKTFRNFLIGGFFLNLVLDPIFMFGWFGFPALGLAGVALATICIEVVGCVYLGLRVMKLPLFSRNRLSDYIPDAHIFREIAAQGVPASLNMVTVGAGIFIITWFIAPFGQTAVAAYGIATRVEQIFLLPTIGLTIATLTLVGHSNGAGNLQRARQAVSVCIRYGMYIMTVGAFAIFALAEHLIKIFTGDAEVVHIGALYLRIAAVLTWAYAIMFTNISALQGMKKPMFALWIGLGRQIVAPIIVFTVLSRIFGLPGIWWGIVIINWTAAFVTIFYAKRVFGKYKESREVAS